MGSPSTGLELCVLALGFGVRHALDADHLALIDGLVRRNTAARPNVARAAGLLFALGHGGVILVVCCTVATLAAPWTVPAHLEFIGAALACALLVALATTNLQAALSPGPRHAPTSPFAGMVGRSGHGDRPAAIVATGALFAISFDTLSSSVLFGAAARPMGGLSMAFAAGLSALCGLAAVTTLNAVWTARLSARTDEGPARGRRIMSGAIALLGYATAGLLCARTLSSTVATWAEANALPTAAGVIAFVSLAYVVAAAARLRPRNVGNSAAAGAP